MYGILNADTAASWDTAKKGICVANGRQVGKYVTTSRIGAVLAARTDVYLREATREASTEAIRLKSSGRVDACQMLLICYRQ